MTGTLQSAVRPPVVVPALPPELEQVSPDVRADAAWFWWVFLETDDLADLSPAARRMLAVAAALFLRRGAVATSVRDIARAAGVSTGALYNHFESKEEVLFTLVRFGNDRVVRSLTAAVRPDDPPPLRIRAFVTAWVTGHLGHQSLAQLVRREYLHLTGDRFHEVVRQRRSVRDRLIEIVRDGIGDGSFRLLEPAEEHDVAEVADPTPVAVMVLDLCLAISDWYDPRRGPDATVLADRYVTAALRLLGSARVNPVTPVCHRRRAPLAAAVGRRRDDVSRGTRHGGEQRMPLPHHIR